MSITCLHAQQNSPTWTLLPYRTALKKLRFSLTLSQFDGREQQQKQQERMDKNVSLIWVRNTYMDSYEKSFNRNSCRQTPRFEAIDLFVLILQQKYYWLTSQVKKVWKWHSSQSQALDNLPVKLNSWCTFFTILRLTLFKTVSNFSS